MKDIVNMQCPCCGEDITELVRESVAQYIRRHKADTMNQKLQSDPEKRKRLTAESVHLTRRSSLQSSVSPLQEECPYQLFEAQYLPFSCLSCLSNSQKV